MRSPCWSPCSSSSAITTPHSSFTWCLSTLTTAHLPQMKPAPSPVKPNSTRCSQDLNLHILSQELFLVKVCDVQRTLSPAHIGHSTWHFTVLHSLQWRRCRLFLPSQQRPRLSSSSAHCRSKPSPPQPPEVPEEEAWKLQQLLWLCVLLPDLINRLNDLPKILHVRCLWY